MNDPTHVAAADQQVLITRIFDAPREQVFQAWTDPDQRPLLRRTSAALEGRDSISA
jgi:uncharacterized protein YndB with AHSA1/START domain